MLKRIFVILLFTSTYCQLQEQDHTVAREWNDELLSAIRNDFARPVV